MAVAFNSGSILALGSGTSVSPTFTVGAGANRALIAYVTLFGTTSGVTAVWDNGGTNQSMTLIDSFTNASDFGSAQTVLMFGLAAPISGNKTLRIAWTGTASYSVGAADFTGADQTGGTATFANAVHAQNVTGSSTTATSTITSATGNLVTAQYLTIATADSVSDNQLWLNSAPANNTSANYASGASSVSLTADLTTSGGTKWMSQGVSIQVPAVAGPPGGGVLDLPRSRPFQPFMRTWTHSGALPHTVGNPIRPIDWPLPKAAARAWHLQTWTHSGALPQTVGNPLRPIDWPLPTRAPPAAELRTWAFGSPLTVRTALVVTPATMTFDYPLPRSAAASFPRALLTWIEAPAFFEIPMNAQYDWPLPRVAQRGNDLRTWIQSAPQLTPVAATPPIAQYDWPIPRVPVRCNWLYNWGDKLIIQLLPPPSVAITDLPPRAASGSWTLRTWIEAPAFFEIPMIAQYDWPLPKKASRSADLLTWVQGGTQFIPTGAATPPQANYDWPLPKSAPFPLMSRTWTQTTLLPSIAPFPPFSYDWPLPKAAQRGSDLRTWTQGTQFIPAAALPPQGNYDWPNPRVASRSHDLRTWIQGVNQNLAQAANFDLGGNPNFDWPVPRAAPRAWDLRTWISPTFLPPTGVVLYTFRGPIFSQPRAPVWPVELRSWVQQGLALRALPVVVPATHTYDWPLPIRAKRGRDLDTWVSVRIPIYPPPPPPPPPTGEERPIKQPYGGSGYGSRTARGLRSQSTQQGMSHREIEQLLAQLPPEEQAEFRQMMDDDEVAYLLSNMDSWMLGR